MVADEGLTPELRVARLRRVRVSEIGLVVKGGIAYKEGSLPTIAS